MYLKRKQKIKHKDNGKKAGAHLIGSCKKGNEDSNSNIPWEDPGWGGGGLLPYRGLMGTCGQPGYVFRDFCLKQGIEVTIFCLNQGIDLSIFVLNRISFLGR